MVNPLVLFKKKKIKISIIQLNTMYNPWYLQNCCPVPWVDLLSQSLIHWTITKDPAVPYTVPGLQIYKVNKTKSHLNDFFYSRGYSTWRRQPANKQQPKVNDK